MQWPCADTAVVARCRKAGKRDGNAEVFDTVMKPVTPCTIGATRGVKTLRISTKEEAETFRLSLLALHDDAVIRAFKDACERHNETACSLCLEEMARRNLTAEATLNAEELRAAARVARARFIALRDDDSGEERAPAIQALKRMADYLDQAAGRLERKNGPLRQPPSRNLGGADSLH